MKQKIQRDRMRMPMPIRVAVILLTVCFACGLLLNLYIIINNLAARSQNANAFGITPIVVVKGRDTDKYEDFVKPGELLLVVADDLGDYADGQRVAFSYRGRIWLGEIVSDRSNDGVPTFSVQAVYLDKPYDTPVTENNLIGRVEYNLPYLGYVVQFLASLTGKLLFVGVPLLALIVLMIISEHRERVAEAKEALKKRMQRPRHRLGLIPLWVYTLTAGMTAGAISYGVTGGFEKLRSRTKRAR